MPEILDQIVDALKLAVKLGQAEEAKEPHQAQIDAFMQQGGEMNEDAQAAFEAWALARSNVNRAFRRIGIEPQENWIGKDYAQAGSQFIKTLFPLGGIHAKASSIEIASS